MTFDFDPMPSDPSAAHAFTLYRLLTVLFHAHFCPEAKIADADKAKVVPMFFAGWLVHHAPLLSQDEICTTAGVPPEAWAHMLALAESGTFPESVRQLWYQIVLFHRPPAVAAVRSIAVNVLVTFADGRVTPLTFAGHMVTPIRRDGELADAVRSAVDRLVAPTGEDGVAKTHALAADLRGTTANDPFEVLMGACVKIVPQLNPEYREICLKWVRFITDTLRPVVPNQFLQRQRLEAADKKPAVGGFNVGQ